MKHIILFLNHPESRLDNAVYRSFTQNPAARRNATLLFPPKLPDERSLTYVVNTLRRKEGRPTDVTFHICVDFCLPAQAEDVVQTLRLIRRLFPAHNTSLPTTKDSDSDLDIAGPTLSVSEPSRQTASASGTNESLYASSVGSPGISEKNGALAAGDSATNESINTLTAGDSVTSGIIDASAAGESETNESINTSTAGDPVTSGIIDASAAGESETNESLNTSTAGDSVTSRIIDASAAGETETNESLNTSTAGDATSLPESQAHPTEWSYPAFVYAMTPDAATCGERERSTLWRNLSAINGAAAYYAHDRLMHSCYLYLETQQGALAEYLTQVASNDEFIITPPKPKGDQALPPVFGSFNAWSLSYPEEEIRHYLQLCCQWHTLRLGDTKANPTDMQEAVSQAQSIMQQLPLGRMRLMLLESMMLNLEGQETHWAKPEQYWPEQTELAAHGLADLPRDSWLPTIRERVETLYQSRYRGLGVEYFYQVQSRLIGDYNRVLLALIGEQLDACMQRETYPPLTQKVIVNAIINALQQSVLATRQQQEETHAAIARTEAELDSLRHRWDGIGLLGRLRGKQTEVLNLYVKQIAALYEMRTIEHGCQFAISLLNQLIPQLSAFSEEAEQRQQYVDQALAIVGPALQGARPHEASAFFDLSPVAEAAQAIAADTEQLDQGYHQLTRLFYTHGNPMDGDDLLSRIRIELNAQFEAYIVTHVRLWTQPPVLDISIGERIEQLYASQGGKAAFVESLKPMIPITIATRLSPETKQDTWHYSESQNRLLMVHILHGLTLADLDGFSGQKLYIEPTLF